MESTVRRGVSILVLVGLSFLMLWWLLPKGDDRGGWVVTAVHSGDTITVERDGETHLVHLAGIRAPAVGECGFEQSRDYLADGIGGVEVTLVDVGLPDVDGAWQRYVDVDVVVAGGVAQPLDAGLGQIAESHAIATDDDHPRAVRYHQADYATSDPCSADS